MGFLSEQCSITPLNETVLSQCKNFSCGDSDLDDFFWNDSVNYSKQLLGKSYCFRLDKDPSVIVCAFTVSNSAIKASDLPNNRKKKVTEEIPHSKQLKNYPAVLIGRLGVNQAFAKNKVGTDLMHFIKLWFADQDNKTGCRFIIVDAYNQPIPKKYYESNGFKYLFSSEEQEKSYFNINKEGLLETRFMYFDLISLD